MAPSFDISDWQLFTYILFSLLMLFSAWQGWLHGMGRCATMLAGVAIGYFAGKTLGFLILDLYQSLIPYPKPILQISTNIIFGVLVYFMFVAGAIFLFKSTRKQPTTSKKLVSGVGGVFFGICNGLIVCMGLVIAIRLAGINRITIPPQPGSLEFRQKEEVFLPGHLQQDAKFPVAIYRAIMAPPLREWVQLANPVPEKFYELLLNLRILSSRKDLLEAFRQLPEVQNLLNTPEIASLLENSTVLVKLEQGAFHDLIRDPEFLELYERESASTILLSMDWNQLTNQVISASDLANHPDL
jgi:hypothetical protein